MNTSLVKLFENWTIGHFLFQLRKCEKTEKKCNSSVKKLLISTTMTH